MREPRIAYVFTSHRDAVLRGVEEGTDADTSLHGLTHLPGAEHVTVWRATQAFSFLPRLLRYDVVISQDNLFLGYLVSLFARLGTHSTHWFYLAMNSSTLMRRHRSHPLRLFLLKLFWRSYSRIICISAEQQDDFIRLGIKRERLVLVPFGVDATFFRPTEASREEDLIVSGGRDAGRDYATLFRAVEHGEHPCIVFTAPNNLVGLSVPKQVSVRYGCTLVEVRELYARARVVVVASKGAAEPEGSDCSGQTVILDALAAGKAVIATHRSWIPEYLTIGEDLVVVPPGDPAALREAIAELMGDAARRARLAASGRAKVAERYTTETFAQRLQSVIRSVL